MSSGNPTNALELSHAIKYATEDLIQNMSDLRKTQQQRCDAMIGALAVVKQSGASDATQQYAEVVAGKYLRQVAGWSHLDGSMIQGAIHNARAATGITEQSGGLCGGGEGIEIGGNPFLLIEGLKAQTQLMNRTNGAAAVANEAYVHCIGFMGNALEADGDVDEKHIMDMYRAAIMPVHSYLNTVPHLAQRMANAKGLCDILTTSRANPAVALQGGGPDVARRLMADANRVAFVCW